VRSSIGWEVKDWYSIPDLSIYGQPDFQIDMAIFALESEYAVQISISTPNAFRNPDANGYVNYNPADPPPTGRHAILAVGFVDNADLPAGVPDDPDGRGYVIIKNSWGIGYGDCGFSYLSTEFLRQWGIAYRYVDKTLDFG
jgi:C1A family cysteine protease